MEHLPTVWFNVATINLTEQIHLELNMDIFRMDMGGLAI